LTGTLNKGDVQTMEARQNLFDACILRPADAAP
jgi:hypothetical protein